MTRTVTRTCPLCEATCGLKITVAGARVDDVRGDPDDVFSRGYICPKGAALGALHHDPDRLKRPLIRGSSGNFEEASWGEAFGAVETGFQAVVREHGRESVAAYLGNPNLHQLAGTFYLRPLLRALGTRHIYSASTVDQMPRHVVSGLMYGDPLLIPVPDLDRTDWLMVIGANPLVSNGSICTAPDFPGRLRALQKRGGILICVDPRYTRTAARADRHVPIRPGGDVFLLLAMVNTLFEHDLVDPKHLRPLLDGFDTLASVVSEWTPERVQPQTGLTAAQIRQLAHGFAKAEKPAIYGRLGTCAQRHGTLATWLIDVLAVVRGRLDAEGGAMYPRSAHSQLQLGATSGGKGWRMGRWHSRVRQLPEVLGELPTATMVDEMMTPGHGQIRALLTVAGNPVLSSPDSERLAAALDSLEFVVSVDPYLNETTRFADVILPPPSPLYRSAYHLAFYDFAVRNTAHFSRPVFALPDGHMCEAEILLRLTAVVSGQGRSANPWDLDDALMAQAVDREVRRPGSPIEGRARDDILAMMDELRGPERWVEFRVRCGPYGDHFGGVPDGLTLARLEHARHGVDFGALEPRLPGVLKTRNGSIHLCPPPFVSALASLDDEPAPLGPSEALLIGRRSIRTNNSWMHNLPLMVAGKSRCTLRVHPEDAERWGLSAGQLAHVTSRVGAIRIAVEPTTEMRRGVVSIPHGWGHDAEDTRLSVASSRPGVNVNRLVNGETIDVLSGNAVLNGIRVRIRPVLEPSGGVEDVGPIAQAPRHDTPE